VSGVHCGDEESVQDSIRTERVKEITSCSTKTGEAKKGRGEKEKIERLSGVIRLGEEENSINKEGL